MNLNKNQEKLLNDIKNWIVIESYRKLELHERLSVSNLIDEFETTGVEFPWDEVEKELGIYA